jgi:hypothetical protein
MNPAVDTEPTVYGQIFGDIRCPDCRNSMLVIPAIDQNGQRNYARDFYKCSAPRCPSFERLYEIPRIALHPVPTDIAKLLLEARRRRERKWQLLNALEVEAAILREKMRR